MLGLFQAGISQSGTALCAWAFAPKGEGVAHGKKLARIFDCPTENSQNMIDCLRRVDPLTIIAQDRKFMVSSANYLHIYRIFSIKTRESSLQDFKAYEENLRSLKNVLSVKVFRNGTQIQ